MAAVIGRQINAVCLMVRRNDDAAAIEHGMQVLFFDAQHVRRRKTSCGRRIVSGLRRQGRVLRFAHAQDDGLEKAVEAPEHLLWRDFGEIPRANRALHRL
jgi:hypothetical protein